MICFLFALTVCTWARPAVVMLGGCTARRETPAQVYKEKVYNEMVLTRNSSLASALATRKFERAPKSYYLIEPQYSCDVDLRVGDVIGDGAKYVCNPHHIQEQPSCIYYGFGVNGNVMFEQALQKVVSCEMHAFDPTPSVVAGAQPGHLAEMGVEFHPWGLSGADEKIKIAGAEVQAYTLETIRSKLQHNARPIDILKIDIEGSEWATLQTALRHCNQHHPIAHQILVELHSATQAQVTRLYDDLTRCGYRPFHKDANHYSTNYMEYAFVHWHFLKCM